MNSKYVFIIGLFSCILLLVSCGRAKTERLLLNKKWEVYDVTAPGNFDIETYNRAQDLKNGFYKNAWFRFLPDSIFITSFSGKSDTGKYHINSGGQTISLYPLYSNKMYEEIQIQKLDAHFFDFNTLIADFNMTLHLKAEK
ncbi:MAG: hypothetical protein EPN37_17535 [Chitinophagaceae bacterium]|nr:MAG: hypothetical protein EPN37_17535 [Chitinophagaceae bacterium]